MHHHHFMLLGFKIRQSGFTLIEVLITMIVLAIGLLGFASLQAINIKTSRTAFYRSFATMYAYDMLDSMRANRAAAKAGNYNISFGATAPSGSTVVDVDRAGWLTALAADLPNGQGQINVTNSRYATVEVQWTEDADGTSKSYTWTTTADLR